MIHLQDKEIQADFDPMRASTDQKASSGVLALEEDKQDVDNFENNHLIEKVQMLTENVSQKDMLVE